jgi:hypothetical protein
MLVASLFLFSASLFVYQASRPTMYEYGIYKMGTPIESGKVQTTINSMRFEQGTGSMAAPAGKQYLILDVSLTNTSNNTVAILPSTDTYIKTTDGKVYFLTPYALEQAFRAGDLRVGDKITGELSYLVPKDTSYTMYIDSVWSGGVISVRLT